MKDEKGQVWNIKDMSEQELHEVANDIQKRLEDIKEGKEELKRRKKEYALIKREPEYELDYVAFWELVIKMIEQGKSVDSSNIDEINKKSQRRDSIPTNEIYPCPKCGKIGALYVGEFGDYDPYMGTGKSRKKVICSCCDFESNGKYQETDYDAWDTFHDWLVKQGYLDASEQKPWEFF